MPRRKIKKNKAEGKKTEQINNDHTTMEPDGQNPLDVQSDEQTAVNTTDLLDAAENTMNPVEQNPDDAMDADGHVGVDDNTATDNTVLTPPPRIIHARREKRPRQPTPNKKTPQKRRKPNLVPFCFTPDQEKDLAEWYRDNPCLYDKRSKQYRLTQLKKKITEEKAKLIKDSEGNECTFEQLVTWLNNMRSCYGKLTKQQKSGSGAGEHQPTDREVSIQNTFTFLRNNIVRIKGRQGCKLQLSSQISEDTDLESDDGLSSHDVETLSDEDSQPGTSKGKGKLAQKKRKKTEEESDTDTIEKICSTILKNVAPTPSTSTLSPFSELENFAKDVVCSMKRIPEDKWNDVKTEIMMVIRNYSTSAQSKSASSFSNEYKQMSSHYPYNNNAAPRFNPASLGNTIFRPPFSNQSQYPQESMMSRPPDMQTACSPGVQLTQMNPLSQRSHISMSNNMTPVSNSTDSSMDDRSGDMFGFNV